MSSRGISIVSQVSELLREDAHVRDECSGYKHFSETEELIGWAFFPELGTNVTSSILPGGELQGFDVSYLRSYFRFDQDPIQKSHTVSEVDELRIHGSIFPCGRCRGFEEQLRFQ